MEHLDILGPLRERFVGEAERLVAPAQARETLGVQHGSAQLGRARRRFEILNQSAVEAPRSGQVALGLARGRQIEAGEEAVRLQGKGPMIRCGSRGVVATEEVNEPKTRKIIRPRLLED